MAGIYVFFSVECILKAHLSRKNGARKKAQDCDDVTEPEKMVRVLVYGGLSIYDSLHLLQNARFVQYDDFIINTSNPLAYLTGSHTNLRRCGYQAET